MVNLTISQSDELYEIAELHLKWYKKYYGENSPKFEILLELNHVKLDDILDGDIRHERIIEVLKSMRSSYETLLNDYSYGPEID